METIIGINASKGYAIGRAFFNKTTAYNTEKISVDDTASECLRFHTAKAKSLSKLDALYQKALKETNPENAEIFEVHKMMTEDLDFVEGIEGIINNEKANAEYAIHKTAEQFKEMFLSSGDEYMTARAADVIDIEKNLLSSLSGTEENNLVITDSFILCADDLTPGETISLDKDKVLAFVTQTGSMASHSSILARTMGIPAVVGLKEKMNFEDGTELIVDGNTGLVIINPDTKTLEKYKTLKNAFDEEKKALLEMKGKNAVSLDGVEIEVFANIGHPKNVDLLLENDAQGIGLFRSEFIYLESESLPTEEYQFEIYKEVLEKTEGRRVIIRTLDLGADKQVPYLDLGKEDNPALGYRAVRISLGNRKLFNQQLRALYRASAYGNLAIMIPMIVGINEVLQVKKQIENVKKELTEEGLPFSENVPLGIMIETPAAVIISDILAQHVDFFSIGTNDLTQYTLAADRMNDKLSDIYNPRHPAVLRMIKMTVENGNRHGVWTGICGDSASDLSLIPTYLALGVKELSVVPSDVLSVKKAVRETDVSKIKEEILQELEGGSKYVLQNSQHLQP